MLLPLAADVFSITFETTSDEDGFVNELAPVLRLATRFGNLGGGRVGTGGAGVLI